MESVRELVAHRRDRHGRVAVHFLARRVCVREDQVQRFGVHFRHIHRDVDDTGASDDAAVVYDVCGDRLDEFFPAVDRTRRNDKHVRRVYATFVHRIPAQRGVGGGGDRRLRIFRTVCEDHFAAD